MKISRILSSITTVFALVLSPQVFAGQLYGGAFFSALNASANYEYNYSCIGPCAVGNAVQRFQDDLNQYGYGGGLVIGAWFPAAHHRYVYGVALDWMVNANKGVAHDFNDIIPPSNSDILTQYRMLHNVSLAFEVLMNITRTFAAYAKVGPSFTYAKFNVEIVGNFTPGAPVGRYFPEQSASDSKVYWGWVAGFGLMAHLTACVDLVFEFDHMGYGSHSASDIITAPENVLPNGGLMTRRYQNISANDFRLGVNFKLTNI